MLVSTYHVSDEARANARRQWVEARPFLIGSASDCHVVIDDPEVAPRHLQVSVSGGAIVVENLASTADIDGMPLSTRETIVVDEGRPIRIGGTVVKVRMQTAAVVATTARGSNPSIRDSQPPARPPTAPLDPSPFAVVNPPPVMHARAPSRLSSPAIGRPPTRARTRKPILSDDPAEQRFLDALRANPADQATRGVYADWLEERGQLAKAELVRLREHMDTYVHKSAGEIEWRAVVVRTPIEHCILNRCPQYWDALVALEVDDFYRRCGTCNKHVAFCGELNEARAAAFEGQPCVFDVSLDRIAAHEAYRKFGEQPVIQADDDDSIDDDPDGYTLDTSTTDRR